MPRKCNYEGCECTTVVDCYLPDDDLQGEPHAYFCAEHCHDNGFCWCCGTFNAGIESFDFRPSGLCDNCEFELRYDDCDEEEDFANYNADDY